jgi:hypothetical protein
MEQDGEKSTLRQCCANWLYLTDKLLFQETSPRFRQNLIVVRLEGQPFKAKMISQLRISNVIDGSRPYQPFSGVPTC